MTTQAELFAGPAPQKDAAKPKSKGPLKAQMLAKFRSHRYASFTFASILAAFPTRQEKSVQHALLKLIRSGHVKAVPGKAATEPLRYTLTLYKS